jgi:hypothetical protein
MAAFGDLKFESHKNHGAGVQAVAFFPNGYGVSVIQSPSSYGGNDGLYELAVLSGGADEYELTYDTPVTSDVEGWLTPDRVAELMAQVEALPARLPA